MPTDIKSVYHNKLLPRNCWQEFLISLSLLVIVIQMLTTNDQIVKFWSLAFCLTVPLSSRMIIFFTAFQETTFFLLRKIFRLKSKKIKCVKMNFKTITKLVPADPNTVFSPINAHMRKSPILDAFNTQC